MEPIVHSLQAAIKNRGATIDPTTHKRRSTGYAVSPYKSREYVCASVSLAKFFAFRRVNRDLLDLPNHYVGLWFDTDSNRWFYDVVIVVNSRDEAERIGRECEQLAIFWLDESQEIRLAPAAVEWDDVRAPKHL